MTTELVRMGSGNFVVLNRIIAVNSPNLGQTRNIIQKSRNMGMLIDLTNGLRTKAVAFTDSGHIILLALAPEHLPTARIAGQEADRKKH